ncbi:MAG: hypothetical protein V4773_12345 [Verrucomicrobiota bacterium]
MRYFKRPWDESRGDEYDGWGTSVFYFEADDRLWVSRQIEVYANGTVLQYSDAHREDNFGQLAHCALEPLEEYISSEITPAEFEAAWAREKPVNARAVSPEL